MTDISLTSSSPRRIRQRNEIAALQALHRSGPFTRAALARELRVNRSSSGHIVAALVADGLVREVDGDAPPLSAPARAGRPGTRLELMPQALCFIGVEIGVEHLAIVEIDLAGTMLANRIEPFDGPGTSVQEAVRQAVALALQTVPEERRARCEGLGVAIPAQISRLGKVHVAPLLGWRDVDLADLVREALPMRVPVAAENDANAFAIGASYVRGELRTGVTLFLVMESGVGGGIVMDGSLFRGGAGLAGEVGHLLVPVAGTQWQTLERVIGLKAVLERFREEVGEKAGLDELRAGLEAGRYSALARDWADALAYGLVQACRMIDPDRIVLGGSLATLFPALPRRLSDAMTRLQEPGFPLPAISVIDLEASGPAFGAACMLHQRYLSLESQRLAKPAGTEI